MHFNADTRKFEAVEGNGKAGNFGFDEGSREDLWMMATHQYIAEKWGAGDEGDKRKRKLADGKVATLFNRAYDFMFWCDEKNIEFYPTTEQRPFIPTKKGEDLFGLRAALHRLPLEDAMRRAEMDLTIPLVLGPLEPSAFDEDTDECTFWTIMVAPWRPDQEIENALMTRQKEMARKAHFNPVEHHSEKDWAEDVLGGVSIVDDGMRVHSRSLLPQ